MSSHRGHHTSTAGTSTAEASPDWRTRAACREAVPELFFPPATDDDGHRPTKAQKQDREQLAKQICADCTSILDCLNSAIDERDEHAIRGGMTADERKAQFGAKCVQCKRWWFPISGRLTCSPACAKKRHDQQKKDRQRKKVVA